jgi:hypothetical protein
VNSELVWYSDMPKAYLLVDWFCGAKTRGFFGGNWELSAGKPAGFFNFGFAKNCAKIVIGIQVIRQNLNYLTTQIAVSHKTGFA